MKNKLNLVLIFISIAIFIWLVITLFQINTISKDMNSSYTDSINLKPNEDIHIYKITRHETYDEEVYGKYLDYDEDIIFYTDSKGKIINTCIKHYNANNLEDLQRIDRMPKKNPSVRNTETTEYAIIFQTSTYNNMSVDIALLKLGIFNGEYTEF